MRAIRWRRIFTVCWIFPLFFVLSFTNNICLLLDWIFFSGFRNQKVDRPVFIVSLPRTGTTNLLHGLTDPGMPFTSLALWESMIAPSIIQKKLIRLVWFLMPKPGKNFIRFADQKIFKKLNIIHKASLFCSEEDELALRAIRV